MKRTSTEYVEKWLKLNQEGHFQEAKNYYFDNLFGNIIDDFKARTEGSRTEGRKDRNQGGARKKGRSAQK